MNFDLKHDGYYLYTCINKIAKVVHEIINEGRNKSDIRMKVVIINYSIIHQITVSYSFLRHS